jgi:hypothetical protein
MRQEMQPQHHKGADVTAPFFDRRPKWGPWRRRGRTGVPADHFPKAEPVLDVKRARKRIRAEQARRRREADRA